MGSLAGGEKVTRSCEEWAGWHAHVRTAQFMHIYWPITCATLAAGTHMHAPPPPRCSCGPVPNRPRPSNHTTQKRLLQGVIVLGVTLIDGRGSYYVIGYI